MTRARFRLTILVATLLVAGAARAELPPELQKLDNKFFEHYNAGEVEASEAAALELVRVADKLGQAHGRAIAMRDLALVRSSMTGDPDQAVKLLNGAIEIYRKAHGQDVVYANLVENLGWHYLGQEDYPRAESNYAGLVPLYERLQGTDSVRYAHVMYNVGLAVRGQGRLDQALACFERSLPGYLKHEVRSAAVANEELGGILFELERLDEAANRYTAAGRIYTQIGGDAEVDAARMVVPLAEIQYAQEKYAEAIKALLWAIPVLDAAGAQRGGPMWELGRAWSHLGDARFATGQNDQAAAAYEQAGNVYIKIGGDAVGDAACVAVGLSDVFYAQGRYAESRAVIERWLPTLAEAAGKWDNMVWTLGQAHVNLGMCLANLNQAAEAEAAYSTAIGVFEKQWGPDDENVAAALEGRAQLHLSCDRLDQADADARRALAIREKTLPPGDVGCANAIRLRGQVALGRGRLDEARDQLLRASRLMEQAVGPDDVANVDYLLSFGYTLLALSQFSDAEKIFRRSLGICETKLGPEHPCVADHASALGLAHLELGRLVESSVLFERALAISRKRLGEQSADTAEIYRRIASVYALQGRYAEAEAQLSAAIRILESLEGDHRIQLADTLELLAVVYEEQHRAAEAEQILERVVETYRLSPYARHVLVANSLVQLAKAYMRTGRHDEAKELLVDAIGRAEPVSGGNNRTHAFARFWLGMFYFQQGRLEAAEEQIKRNLAIAEKLIPLDSLEFGYDWSKLAEIYAAQGRDREAEELLERAIANLERAQALPADRYSAYLLRARLAWRRGAHSEALADLRTAMDLAEEQRGQATGAELERATFFAGFSAAFEQMVQWQVEREDPAEALAAMERARARSLLDELTMPGADLGLGRTAAERARLNEQESELKSRVVVLEKQAEQAERDSDAARQLQADLSSAKRQLYEHHRDARSRNPIYRQLLSTGAGPPRLSQLQRSLVGPDGLLLVYLVGESGGYVAAVDGDRAEVSPLAADADAAADLEIEPGPLTAERLNQALANSGTTGIMQLMRRPEETEKLNRKLAALWRTILPECHRDVIVSGRIKHLIVVPDGPLALLPFETLVVRSGSRPTYLLDAGPPITYGPSATVLHNLAQRTGGDMPDGREPVLTVGDPVYAGDDAESTQVVATRYARSGGTLRPLPFSGVESDWVSKAFQESGVSSTVLVSQQATESNVRGSVAGRQIVHLACHGLADQSHGNFFGALALTRGGQAEPQDDGFLTLAEVYELDLASCRLAILSACDTNFGPEQKGEGVWALSRGFLVAGSQRVVASNWLVDDQAAANLVSYFCGGVAAGMQQGQVNYAGALQSAKRWIRDQEKWSSPYYWGSLVLVGPR